jgi:hypothetical protein
LLNQDVLRRIGPQLHAEPPLLRRLRFHQSWYRSEVLGLTDFGNTPAPSARPLGSILSLEAADRGLNFVSPDAFQAYRDRRTLGWGLDPVRCTRYLTSSQAFTLNLYGPLTGDGPWLARTLGIVLGQNLKPVVNRAGLEYAPRFPSLHLNDQTRIDMYFELESDTGPFGLAVETKYGDRFSNRFLDISRRERYSALNDRWEIWDTGAKQYGTREIEQLARVHALATSKFRQSHGTNSRLLLIHHSMDEQARVVADSYRATLNDPALLTVTDAESFLQVMSITALNDDQRALSRRLKERYTDLRLSEEQWGLSRSKLPQD